MSTTRDPDRILRAWLDQMPSEAPDRAIDAVLLATEAASQVRAWPWRGPWRPNQMNRLTLIAATAVVALAVVGGAMLLAGNKSTPPAATATPPGATASVAPTSSPEGSAPTTPTAVQSWWVANAPAGSASKVLTLEIQSNLITVHDAGSDVVVARPIADASGQLAFDATDSVHGCQAGEVGRYRFELAQPTGNSSAGTMLLSLTATADACPARQTLLARVWTRVFTNGFKGGRAVGVDFDPMFMVTLPTGAYDVTVAANDALMVESPSGNAPGIFVATRNPAGFADPCSETGGAKVPLAHTVDAFATYMDALPGFTVQRTNVTIDGRPAVHLTVPTTITADCPRADHRVIEWSTSDPTFTWHIILGQGDPDSIYLVEVGEDLYLFQWLTPTLDSAAEMSVLSTLKLIDTIPG